MNVYDNANELAKAMRESHEYKKLKEAAAVLEKDPDAKKMVNEYLKKLDTLKKRRRAWIKWLTSI